MQEHAVHAEVGYPALYVAWVQECVFSGNEPDILDSFSKGMLYSDGNITVWNEEAESYEITRTLEQAEEEVKWLYGSDNFITNMRRVRT